MMNNNNIVEDVGVNDDVVTVENDDAIKYSRDGLEVDVQDVDVDNDILKYVPNYVFDDAYEDADENGVGYDDLYYDHFDEAVVSDDDDFNSDVDDDVVVDVDDDVNEQ